MKARLETEVTGSARAQVELELARVQNGLAVSEDGRLKAESELDFDRPWLRQRRPAGRLRKRKTA